MTVSRDAAARRSRGEDVRFSGYWATYARSLPGDELVASLPSSWSEPELERRLGGTSLSQRFSPNAPSFSR